jgi:hypothetical protein
MISDEKTVKIYLIEDINDLRYVGSTNQKYLNSRFSQHKYHKKIGHTCSSSKLNLDNATITELEICQENERHERERHWVKKLGCVNDRLQLSVEELNESKKVREREKSARYYEQHKNTQEYKDKAKKYYKDNKEYFKEYSKKYRSDPEVKWKLDQYGKEYREKKKVINDNNNNKSPGIASYF